MGGEGESEIVDKLFGSAPLVSWEERATYV
jgi:hypothetical protein